MDQTVSPDPPASSRAGIVNISMSRPFSEVVRADEGLSGIRTWLS